MREKSIHNTQAIKKAIDILGSMQKLASAMGTTVSSVYNWNTGKVLISPIHCMKIEKATKGQVTKEEIRPDFDWKNFKLI